MHNTPQAGGNPSPDRPRVPPQKHGTPRDREPGPGPGRDALPADNQVEVRKAKQSNAPSPQPRRSLNTRGQTPPSAASVGPNEEQTIEVRSGPPERGRRRPDGSPPLAQPSLPAQRPAILSTLLDFHERRANVTGSVDEEIRLLRAHEKAFWRVFIAPALILLLLGIVIVAKAPDLGLSLGRFMVALAIASAIGATLHLLRGWIADRRSTRKGDGSRRSRRR
ncbi:hypothetical protein ACI2K4_22290 [Micromonospora sp. NPDC050397]|uniref:hypothetical protein n=1 Tax=Micromonospora sp. NPDC050397 TaxID=3364279 RepID=UPI00384BD1DF